MKQSKTRVPRHVDHVRDPFGKIVWTNPNKSDMLCEHKESKPKLIARAYDCRYHHHQWFETVECCAKCGTEIKEPRVLQEFYDLMRTRFT